MSAVRATTQRCVAVVGFVTLVTACTSHEPRPSATPYAAAVPQRCTLRLVRGRILVDGEPMPRDAAIERCKHYVEAVVYLEDPALCDEWSTIEADFRRSRVRVYVSGPTGGTDRFGRPMLIRVNGRSPEWKPLPRTCP